MKYILKGRNTLMNMKIKYALIFFLPMIVSCVLQGDLDTNFDYPEKPVTAADIFDDSENHIIEITVDTDILNKILEEGCLDERPYRLITRFRFDGKKIENAAMRSRGNSSCSNVKRQFKISFDITDPMIDAETTTGSFPEFKTREFCDLESLNLRSSQNDPTLIREMMAFKIFRKNNIPATRVSTAEVFINNQYWGEYLATEQIDKTFLKNWFSNANGNLYKSDSNATFVPGSYNPNFYELVTNEETNDITDIQNFMVSLDAVDSTTDLDQILFRSNIINYYAVSSIIGHWDSLAGVCNNDYVYHNPTDDRWYIIVWDCDNTFGSDWAGDTINADIYNMHTSLAFKDTSVDHNITNRALSIPEVRDQYTTAITAMIADPLPGITFTAEVNRIRDMIKGSVSRDPNIIEYEEFLKAFDEYPLTCPVSQCGQYTAGFGLKSWFAQRITNIAGQL